jgi:hypothetical protein
MAQRGWTNYAQLENYYENQLLSIMEGIGKQYIVWYATSGCPCKRDCERLRIGTHDPYLMAFPGRRSLTTA